MAQRLPIDAEAVLTNALEETVAVGVLTYEQGVLSPEEKQENLTWVACRT